MLAAVGSVALLVPRWKGAMGALCQGAMVSSFVEVSIAEGVQSQHLAPLL